MFEYNSRIHLCLSAGLSLDEQRKYARTRIKDISEILDFFKLEYEISEFIHTSCDNSCYFSQQSIIVDFTISKQINIRQNIYNITKILDGFCGMIESMEDIDNCSLII